MSSTPSLTKIIFKPCGLILIISLLLGLIPPFALAENRYYDPSSKEELCGDEQDQDGNGQAETLSDCACPEQVTSEEFTKIRSFITGSQLILIQRKDDNSQDAKYFPWDKTGKNNLFCPLTDALLYYLYQELAKITPPKATTSNFYYFHNDHLSGTTVVTDEQGNLVEVRDYYPYGEDRPLSTSESIPPPPMHQPPKFDSPTKNIPATPYGFTGKEQDTETGLHYFGSRFYNAAIGRFTQQDPSSRDNPEKFLKDPQQLNTYSYARNNPLAFKDEEGKSATEIGGFMGMVAGAIGGSAAASLDYRDMVVSLAHGDLFSAAESASRSLESQTLGVVAGFIAGTTIGATVDIGLGIAGLAGGAIGLRQMGKWVDTAKRRITPKVTAPEVKELPKPTVTQNLMTIQKLKGNVSLDPMTREEVDALGRSFVGENPMSVIEKGQPIGIRNTDYTRIYRFPSYKDRGVSAGKTQANLEEYFRDGSNNWVKSKNVHIDIIDKK